MWPEGRTASVILSFDFDAEEMWIGENPANAERPGVLSQGGYSPRVGVPLILDLLARHEVKASFFVSGRDIERHPAAVRAIVAAGHEVGHHGYTHRSPTDLSVSEEEDELVRADRLLRGLGVDPVGYRSPSWDFSRSTAELLAQHSYRYSSNFMDDIRPYRHANGLIELPVHWMLDDAPYFWFDAASWTKSIRPTAEVLAIWQEEITGIADLGGLAIITMHPMLTGRPSRLAMLDRLLAWLRDQPQLWIATAREVAEHASEHLHSADDVPQRTS